MEEFSEVMKHAETLQLEVVLCQINNNHKQHHIILQQDYIRFTSVVQFVFGHPLHNAFI